jgi:hypothetical protein
MNASTSAGRRETCAAGHAWESPYHWSDNFGRVYESVVCTRCGMQERRVIVDPSEREGGT